MKGKKLYVLDGHALAYRSFFAFRNRPLINSKGQDTSAVFGFTNTLLKLLREEKPDLIAVALDSPGPTFRHRLFEEYKAARPEMPDELRRQLPRIREIVEAMNIPLVESSGYEADDIMGTIARLGREADLTVILVTGDKDLFQLVSDSVLVLYPHRGGESMELMDPAAVEKKMGVPPAKVADLLALMGDNVDNVPGVPGIGEKTALKLIGEFGSFQDVLDKSDRVGPPGVKRKLDQHRDQALLSRKLVNLDLQVPIGVDLNDLVASAPDIPRLKQLFTELEFSRFLRELVDEDVERDDRADYAAITSLDGLERAVEDMRQAGEFAIDLETDSLDQMKAGIAGISFAWEPHKACYLPLGHRRDDGSLASGNLPADRALDILRPLLADPGVTKVGQNIKYDWAILTNHGIDLRGVTFDTMIASYCLNPGRRRHNLDLLALEHFQHRMIPISDLIGKGRNQRTFDQVEIEPATVYSCEDSDYTFQLKSLFEKKLQAVPSLESLFNSLEMPLVQVLIAMERAGVRIDVPFFRELSGRMAGELEGLQAEIYKQAGVQFNINSPKQLAHVLFEKLGLPGLKKTKSGFSTDADVLTELAREHELPRVLLRYRELSKLKTTYVDALPVLVNPKTSRLHTSFNQTVTATGRLSSSDPNLQNIPIRTAEGREIRRGFVAGGDDRVLLSVDYSQVELRVMAHLSGDQGMIQAFERGEDIHRATAAKVFNLHPEAVTPELRNRAKEVNFGVIFGMGEFGLSQRLGISRADAARFIDGYFGSYPKVKEFMERLVDRARELGYAETLLGRRRYLPELAAENRNVRQGAERMAINTAIQGTAADLIKKAMIRIDRELDRFSSPMILQVHDELLFDARADEVEDLGRMVAGEMESALDLDVPLVVETGAGPNWAEAH